MRLSSRPAPSNQPGCDLAAVEFGRSASRVLVLTGCAGWLFFERDEADFQSFAVMFSPVVTLVATVLAFYFGSPKD